MTTRTATKTDSTPFDFNLDTVKSEVNLDPFRVHFGGRRWEFAHLNGLDVWDLVEVAEGGDTGATIGLFRAALGDEAFAEFRKVSLPQYKMRALLDAYQEHCGMQSGESEASAS